MNSVFRVVATNEDTEVTSFFCEFVGFSNKNTFFPFFHQQLGLAEHCVDCNIQLTLYLWMFNRWIMALYFLWELNFDLSLIMHFSGMKHNATNLTVNLYFCESIFLKSCFISSRQGYIQPCDYQFSLIPAPCIHIDSIIYCLVSCISHLTEIQTTLSQGIE